MHISLGLALVLVVCPAGTALDVPDETAMMQVQLKSAQRRSRATSIGDAETWDSSFYDARRNGTNSSGPGCNIGFKKMPDETGTKSLSELSQEAQDAVGGTGGVLEGVVRGGGMTMVTLSGVTCNCTAHMATNPAIDFCESDGTFGQDANMTPVAMPRDFVPWNLDRIDARRGFDNSYNVNEGLTSTIYVMDSGVLYTHIDSGGRAIPGIEVESGNLVLCKPSNKTCSKDLWGHGSHLAGIMGGNAAGVSKLSRTVGVRNSGYDKTCSMSAWLRAFAWIAKYASKPAQVGQVWTIFIRSTAAMRIGNTVVNSGIVISLASGNKLGSTCHVEPSSFGNVVATGSTDRFDRRSWWSAFGMCITIFAPGESISSWSSTADDSWTEMSGTSMSTPHGAASTAVIMSRGPTLTPADVIMVLVGDATKGVLTNIGAGSPNVLMYLSTDAGKCFPGEATAQVQDFGQVAMMNLHLGDRVRVKSVAGELSYEPILGFLHLVHGGFDRPSEFLNVIHSYGQFRATAGHLVFTKAGDMPVSHLQVGDQIVVEATVGSSKVIAIHQSNSVSGMYAPLTASGAIVVDDVVASNYAAPSNGLWLPHTSAHAFFYPLRFFYQLGFTSAPEEKDDALQPFLMISHHWLRLDKAFVRWASY